MSKSKFSRILVVDDEVAIRESIADFLESEGHKVKMASDAETALQMLEEHDFDVLLTDIRMPGMSGLELMQAVNRLDPQILIIVMTAHGSVESAIQALRSGAADYMLKPLDFDELLHRVESLLERRELVRENRYMRKVIEQSFNFNFIIGESPVMKELYRVIGKVATTRSTVLITGPSGSGKELIARALHYHSERRSRPFVAVNCGSIPENLFESELFGHKKGSFTGAISEREGHFLVANNGTLFLDEVAEMPLAMQVKLLRVLQDNEVMPVGASRPQKIDVRIVAATNRDLEKEVEEGRFREDLFYRLNIIRIQAPSLNQRREDIPLLAEYFLDKHNKDLGTSVKGIEKEAMQMLVAHDWKGQVRELENILERAVLLTEHAWVQPSDLPFIHPRAGSEPAQPDADSAGLLPAGTVVPGDKDTSLPDGHRTQNLPEGWESMPLNDLTAWFEAAHIRRTLERHDWNRSETAKALGIDNSTLYRKMEKFALSEGDREGS